MLATGWSKALVLAGRSCCQLVLAWGCGQGGLVARQYWFLLVSEEALLPVSTGLGLREGGLVAKSVLGFACGQAGLVAS